MSLNLIEILALHAAGMSDDDIAKITSALPATGALIQLVKTNMDLIQQAQTLAARLLPLVQQATTEIKSILPAADAIVAAVLDARPERDAATMAALARFLWERPDPGAAASAGLESLKTRQARGRAKENRREKRLGR